MQRTATSSDLKDLWLMDENKITISELIYLSYLSSISFIPILVLVWPHHLGPIVLVLNTITWIQRSLFKAHFCSISPADALSAIQKPIKLDAFDSFPAKCPFRCRRTHTSKCLKKTSSVSSFWKCHLTQDRPTWVSDFISKKLEEITLIAIIAIIWSLTQVQFTRWREENRTAPAFSTSATRGASLHHRRTELRHGQLVRFWEEFSRWLQVCTR